MKHTHDYSKRRPTSSIETCRCGAFRFTEEYLRENPPIAGRPMHILYDCGICGGLHPWEWAGDCREDANRYAGPDDYATKKGISELDIEVRTMDERVKADEAGN